MIFASSVCTAHRQNKKNRTTATAVFRFELAHVGFSRFLQQSADVSGRMGPHWLRLRGWCAPVHEYIQVSGQTETDGSSVQGRPAVDLSVQPCAQADTADMFGRLTAVQSQRSLQPARSHPRRRVLRVSYSAMSMTPGQTSRCSTVL